MIWLGRPIRLTYLSYGMASLVALGADMGAFVALISAGLSPVSASALGYGLGILVHWLISSRFVFAATAAPRGPARTRQKGRFVVSALVGLAVTIGIVALGDMFGLLPVIAKLVAIVLSFQATYILRKTVVFTR